MVWLPAIPVDSCFGESHSAGLKDQVSVAYENTLFNVLSSGLVAVGEKTQKRHGPFSAVKDLSGET